MSVFDSISIHIHMLVATIVVTNTAFVIVVIEVKTSLVSLPSHRPVVTRKLLTGVAASTLNILIVRHEIAELTVVSTLQESRPGTGFVALQNISQS